MQFGSDVAIQIFPAGKGILVLRHAQHTDQHRWIRAKPGVLRVTLRSFGFTGNGKGWARNPRCTVLIGYTYTSVRNLRGELWDRVTFAARPGQRVTRDIPTGSGLVALVIGTYSVNSPVRAMQGPGVSFYPIVP